MNKRRIQMAIVFVLAAGAALIGWRLSARDDQIQSSRYFAIVTDIEGQVYNGATIQDVVIDLDIHMCGACT